MDDFQERYFQLEKSGFPLDMQFAFSYDIGHSDEIAYHYNIIKDIWFNGKYQIANIESWFQSHNQAGLDFILQQLENDSTVEEKVYACYLAASILSCTDNKTYNKLFRTNLVSLVETTNVDLRRKVIIALGWVGSAKEVDLLTTLMLHDEDSLCRTWAATSLMQMTFHNVRETTIQKKCVGAFLEALSNEQDIFACGCIANTVQTIFSKKWISRTAVDAIDQEKIEKAKKSAIRFLKTLP